MRVERVAYFVEAVRTGSMRAAAERLDVTQSMLGEQIRALEEELNVVLLYRSSRGVSPTRAGQLLLPQALNLIQAQRDLIDGAAGYDFADSGQVTIGATPLLTTTVIAPILGAFHAAHPGVQISIDETSARDDLQRAVGDGRMDLCVVTAPPPIEESPSDGLLSRRTLARLQVAACVPIGHPLAAARQLMWDDLRTEQLISMRTGTTLSQILHRNVSRPRVAAEVASLHSLVALVGAGLGIGVGAAATGIAGADRVRWIPIANEADGILIQIITRLGAPTPPAARILRDAIIVRAREIEQIANAGSTEGTSPEVAEHRARE